MRGNVRVGAVTGGELLLYCGAMIMALAVASMLIAAILLHIKKRKLAAKLEDEYGKNRR